MEIQKQTSAIDVQKLQIYLNAMGMANNLTSGEFQQFVEIAQGFGLNPFKREIYANKYGNQFSVIVGYETYIKRAERSGLLSGWSVKTDGTVNWTDPRMSSLRAEITIHRRDFQHPFVHEVYFSEYFGTTRDGQLTKFWRDKPMTMIKKVAMAQGFRLCFSDELGGMPYTAEELNAMDHTETLNAKVVETKPVAEFTPELASTIESAKTLDELVHVWKSNENLQANPQFKQSLTDKRKKLSEPSIHEPAQSSPRSVDDMIEAIRNCMTENEILELTIDEQRRDVLDAAIERVSELQNNES